jgi:amino-acid N-acetyltransferase
VDVPQLSAATRGDLHDVLALLRQCGLLETGVAETLDGFCVARSARSLVGCAGLESYGGAGLLRSVAVEASARGSGIGSQLVQGVVAAARTRGQSQLFLLTTTAGDFFERRGFHLVERASVPSAIAQSWEFRVGCPQTALVMRLGLEELPSST